MLLYNSFGMGVAGCFLGKTSYDVFYTNIDKVFYALFLKFVLFIGISDDDGVMTVMCYIADYGGV